MASLSQVHGARRGSHIGPLASVPSENRLPPVTRLIDPTYHAPKVLAAPAHAPLQASLSVTFLYDGDGRRVAQTVNNVTTFFVGNYYEETGNAGEQQHIVTKYYYAGSTRVAMRTDDDAAPGTTLNFLLSDHLGSTSLTLNASGAVISEMRYTAWGQVRYQSGTTPTQYQFTGQMSYTESFGLMYYGARWYDPYLNRFAQADTIIPQGQGVQAWDRYAFVNNNPIRYTDPSGHCAGPIWCVVEITKATIFIAKRAWEKGGLDNLNDNDWKAAADYAAPAVADGSKESISITGSAFVTGVASKTLITTEDGHVQVYNETGVGGSLPGVAISATHGTVYGLENDPLNYKDGATQGNVSIPVAAFAGVTGEGYIADGYESSGKPPVYGFDLGLYAGVGPTILGAAHTNATPTDNANGNIPTKLTGPLLLGCRLLSMCGGR